MNVGDDGMNVVIDREKKAGVVYNTEDVSFSDIKKYVLDEVNQSPNVRIFVICGFGVIGEHCYHFTYQQMTA